ncbi:MAG: hypothetical protein ACYDH1_04565 [Anaerolineaceae bacterium]
MGRKGVSKRKAPKVKNQQEPAKNSNSPVSSAMRASEAPAIRSTGKEEAESKKKSSGSKKR